MEILFIMDAIGKIGVILISLSALTVSWLQYDLQRYKLEINLALAPSGSDLHKRLAQPDHNGHLYLLIITNVSKYSFSITSLKNENKEGLIELFINDTDEFGYLIKAGEQRAFPLNLCSEKIEKIKASKRLYVTTSVSKKFRMNKSQLKKIQKGLKNITA